MKLLPSKIFRKINNKSKSITSNLLSDEDSIIEHQQNRIEYLEAWLNKLLIRDHDKLEEDIRKIIAEVSKIQPSMVTYYILSNYGRTYFSKECDTQFKIKLCEALLSYVKAIYPSYKNELLESISKNNSEYAENYIYVEKD